MDQGFDLLTLALLPGIGPRHVHDLAARGPMGEVLAHPEEYVDLLGSEACQALRGGAARREAEAEERRAAALGIRLVGWDDADYPPLLRSIYDPPPVLYVRGRLRGGEAEESLAIVGARAASPQGRALATELARRLAALGLTIVSGLARGIDTAAHRGALEAGGRSVAVLGSGLDQVYPAENVDLARTLAEHGAVVSEFRLGMAPYAGNFPRRNRVIAGWGRGVVVVEAAERSGALVTARCALEEGREVLAVPGHPSHAGSSGTNALIRDGAPLVRDARDVAEALGLVIPITVPVPGPEDAVFAALSPGVPSSLEELAARSGEPTPRLLGRLAALELESKVRRLPGALFVRS